MQQPPSTPTPAATTNTVVVTVDIDSDFRQRWTITGKPEHVERVTRAAGEVMAKLNPQEQFKRTFFYTAHIFVFALAALSVTGMVLDYLNYRKFNLFFLTGMGAWTVVSIAWLYFAIIKDIFNVKVPLPKPPGSEPQ